MTTNEMIGMLMGMGFKDDGRVLSTYLTLAGDAIIERVYPYAKDDEEHEVPKKYQTLQLEIAAYMLNKRGAEGQVSHSENSTQRTWASADIPDDMLSRVVPYVGVIS